ncbi:MAG: DUF1080 domain-containing protein [Anaerohalosphaera sp.]|nr:DUF1080 domain-containing protein [Anaerohalosphaera sp.]
MKTERITVDSKVIIFTLLLFALVCPVFAARSLNQHPATDPCKGWKLGTQAYSFNRFSFYEAIEKTSSLGLNYIEAYPGQKLTNEKGSPKTDMNLSPELRQEVKDRLKAAGIKLVNFGVVGLGNNEQKAREVFEFAKDMGIQTVVSEPPLEAIPMLDKLCQEYKINLAIHNHPKPSRYWNPDTVLEACKGRSKYVGACADTGHWVRSGLDPVECLKKLDGRIKSLHFKELQDGHDVPWGTADNRATPLLAELNRQRFKGVFSIEYEHNWNNSVPEIRKCVEFFNTESAKFNPTGWKPLFDAQLSNADMKPNSWAWEDAVLTRKGGGDIWTKDKYSNFIIDLQFKVAKGSNSGVFIRTGNHSWLPWVEVQVEDSFGKPMSNHLAGGIFDIQAPAANVVYEPGKWNRMTILAKGSNIAVVLNGTQTFDIDLDKWITPNKNPDGTKNKFKIAYKDLPRTGFIGLQDHGQDIWYRNIKIKTLK